MATTKASDLTLGNYLKIVSKGAVYNNLSEDSPIWDLIKKKKKGDAEGRELRFLLRSAYGASAAGFVPVNGGAYPTGDQSTITEGTAQFKDFALTLEVERTLIAKAISDFSRYGEPLAEELRSKTIALSRQLSRSVYGDGTGILGAISSAADAGTNVTFTLKTATTDYGFVGWFELGDKLVAIDDGGGSTNISIDGGTAAYYKVVSKSRSAGTVTCSAWTSADAQITVNGVTNFSGDEMLYRYNPGLSVASKPDVSSAPAADYQTLSEEWAGLESLSEDDGRIVNGITMTGAVAGTRHSGGGNAIDSQDFQQLMSSIMIAVGQGRYKYNKAMMAWETLDALIESREVDRRFNSIEDNKRGVSALGYVHGKNAVMFEADEFCRKDRIFVLPEADVLQFHGSDFDFVKPDGGQKFFLKPNSSGHDRTIRAYMEGDGCLVSVHSPAIGCIDNFTV